MSKAVQRLRGVVVSVVLLAAMPAAAEDVIVPFGEAVTVGQYSLQLVAGGTGFLLEVDDGRFTKTESFAVEETCAFTFPDHVVKLDILDYCELEPVHVRVDMSLAPRSVPDGCRLREERFCNQKALVLENSVVYVVVLPEVGGRIIAMGLQADRRNHFYVNETLLSSYQYSAGWQDLGGLEDNFGAWSGPLWNRKYDYRIEEENADTVSIRLEAEVPPHRLARVMTLNRACSTLSVEMRLTSPAGKESKLGIHPEMVVGGLADVNDVLFFHPDDGEHASVSFRSGGGSMALGRFSGYAGVSDTKTAHALVFSFDQELKAVFYQGSDYYNLELATPADAAGNPEGRTRMAYDLTVLHGVPLPNVFVRGIAASLDIGKRLLKQDESTEMAVRLVSARPFKGTVAVVRKDNNETLSAREVDIAPLEIKSIACPWNAGALPDGEYRFVLELRDDAGNVLIRKSVSVELVDRRFREMNKTLAALEEAVEALPRKTRTQRNQAVKAHFYIEQARAAAEEGDEASFAEVLPKIKAELK